METRKTVLKVVELVKGKTFSTPVWNNVYAETISQAGITIFSFVDFRTYSFINLAVRNNIFFVLQDQIKQKYESV